MILRLVRAPSRLLLLVALLIGWPAAAQPATPEANLWWRGYIEGSRLVALPDGRQLNVYCEGSGTMTVVLESGLGDGAESWRKVQDPLSKITRVCAYDRAGYGASPPGPQPRDVNALVSDLEQLLRSANLKPPYLVVGHSMGGMDARLFVHRHRREVAGLVLVEPSVENQNERFEAVAPGYTKTNGLLYKLAKPCADPVRVPAVTAICVHPPRDLPAEFTQTYIQGRGSAYFNTVIAENDAMATADSAELSAERRPLGAMPLIVLTRDDAKPPPGVTEARAGALLAAWTQMHQEVADLSSRGSNRVVPGTTHTIQLDKPQVVIDAIREVLAEVRTRSR